MDKHLAILTAAMEEAGEAILHLQKKGFSIQKKQNKELLTEADLLANQILQTNLTKAFPHDGWLSEENSDDFKRLACERTWVVDPIDGTKEFVQGLAEYSISVALIEKHEVILAAILNPATNEFIYAIKGKGTFFGKEKLHCRTDTPTKPLLLVSRSEWERGNWLAFEKQFDIKAVGSIAYKMALVALGKAHATVSLGFKNQWDIAAGDLLISEAHGCVSNKMKEKIIYNTKNTLVNGIFGTSKEVNHFIFSLLFPQMN